MKECCTWAHIGKHLFLFFFQHLFFWLWSNFYCVKLVPAIFLIIRGIEKTPHEIVPKMSCHKDNHKDHVDREATIGLQRQKYWAKKR